MKPTIEQYSAYQALCDYFNESLFGGELPRVMLNFSRKSGALGFFAPSRWDNGETKTHEISLNPDHLNSRPVKEIASTLVHELCHLQQQEFGKPSGGGWHNREWGVFMEAVGLIPSDTAAPGGKRTGCRMSHYIQEEGAFEKAFDTMPEECLLPWMSAPEPPKETKSKVHRKSKYACEGCGTQVWGKPGIRVICGECETEFGEVPADGG